jgi:hypothetical protein
MRHIRFAALLPLLSLAPIALATQAHWSAGAELFSWREFPTNCSQTLQEIGPRAFIRYDDRKQDSSDWDLSWHGTVYGGVVAYDGFTQTCTPLTAGSSYFGTRGEAAAIRWLAAPAAGSAWPRFGIDTALGADVWRRTIITSGGYSEDYAIGYARLGLAAQRSRNWIVRVGIKDPFATQEIAHLAANGFSSDPLLHPKGTISYFADLQYRFSPAAQLTFYYDSYRFDASDMVTVNSCPPSGSPCSVNQPRSWQDTFGVSWRMNL